MQNGKEIQVRLGARKLINLLDVINQSEETEECKSFFKIAQLRQTQWGNLHRVLVIFA